ncbi:MAG: hypothetical protein ACRDQA_05600 [Nocardioidaceae bacterium]
MALFDTRQHKSAGRPGRASVPVGYEALADALRHGGDAVAAGHEIGRGLAGDGAAIDEVLSGVDRTYLAVTAARGEPPFAVTRAVAAAWAEESLRYLHAVSCEDPLTGLATLPHIRTRLNELYRAAERSGTAVSAEHALVMVELGSHGSKGASFDHQLRLLEVAERLRSTYSGDETIGQLNPRRVVVVARRVDCVGRSLPMLRPLLGDLRRQRGISSRVWVEGLPDTCVAAGHLLDDLAR